MYLFGYTGQMTSNALLAAARLEAALSQTELAAAAGTSRPTLSAYENGRKSPTLAVAARILDAAGFELTIQRPVRFREAGADRGRPIMVPTTLPRVDPRAATARVVLPLHLNWSDPGRAFNLRERRERARVYEIVLREGTPDDILAYVDGALLIDLWDDLILPRPIRTAWQPLIPNDHQATTAT